MSGIRAPRVKRARWSAGAGLRPFAGPATVALGTAVLAPSAYLAALSLAALRRPRAGGLVIGVAPRLVVLVPAHDEELLLGRCLDSLAAQSYPRECYRVMVIADNCTDGTAVVAAGRKVEVLSRTNADERGKGYALRWAMDTILASGEPFDAFVVVDADSVTDQDLLSGLAAALTSGADAVQGDYLALDEPAPRAGTGGRARLRSAAFLLFHRARFTGRANLGLPCSLVGNGMLFSRRLVENVPWSAYSRAEDLEYSVDLRLRGVRPVFAPQARVQAPVSTLGGAARTQRRRWEGGRAEVVRTRLPRLVRSMVRDRRWDLWDAAADLAVPPLGVLAALVAAGGTAGLALRAVRGVHTRHLLPWAAAAVALPVHVLVGLRAAGAPAETFRALLAAPALVGSELPTRLGLLRRDLDPAWERTARTAG
ncbi:MAG: glycosyltransferase family 2 protein [Mycobacteriales bacterium]